MSNVRAFPEDPAASSAEVAVLRRTVRDLVTLSTLPLVWVESDIRRTVQNLTDVLRSALRCGSVCVRVELPDQTVFETASSTGLRNDSRPTFELKSLLDAPPPHSTKTLAIPKFNGSGPVNGLPQPIYSEQKQIGLFLACFPIDVIPDQNDRLMLVVASNQLNFLLHRCREQEERLARKLAEDRLRQAEHKYEQLVHALPAAVYTCDNEGRIDLFNEAAVNLWGERPKIGEARWCEFGKIFNPDGSPLDHEDCPMGIALREGRSVRGQEIIVERPDGSRGWVLPYPDPIRNGAGELIGTVNMLVDIGPLKAAEQSVRTSEGRLQTLLNLMPAAVYACDLKGRITFYNRRAAELWGREPQLNDDAQRFCAAYRCWFNGRVLPPDQTPMALAVREGQSFRNLEPVFERPDGRKIPVLVNIDPLFDLDGTPAGAINVFQDVTALKQAQAELKARQEQLQAVIENTPECVKLVAEDGTLLAINGAGLCMVEAESQQQVVGQNIYAVIAPEFRDAFREMNKRVCGGAKERFEFEIVGLKGTRRCMETHAAPIVDPVTRKRVQLAVTRDVTQRRRIEEALRESEQWLRGTFEQAAVGIASAALDGAFLQVNGRFCQILGYTAEELRNLKIADLIYPDDLPKTREDMRRLLSGEIPNYASEKRYIRKDGTVTWVLTTVATIKDVSGNPNRFIGVMEDINHRKQIEAELRRRTQELTAFVETAAVALHWVGPDGRILWANAAEMQMLGYSADEYIGRHIAEFHADQPVIDNILIRLTEGEKLCDHEARLKCKDGSIMHVLIDSSVLWEDGKFLHTQCFTRDITDRKRAAEKLEQAVNERTASLREAIAQMEEFSYTVSHDLRAPLRAMQGYSTTLLQDHLVNLPEDARGYLRRIFDNAGRLDKMILDVLTYSRVARAELKTERVSLGTLVRNTIEQYPGLQPPGVQIDIDIQHDVIGHEPSVMQAISNLLINSVKFVGPGVIPKIRIWTEERDHGEVQLSIEDNGIGIDPRCQPKLFTMFERAHPNLKYEGTGVGLAIVRKAIERMGGKVGVESDGRNGSRFWLRLKGAP